jgi:type I restriction enzyme S subunit
MSDNQEIYPKDWPLRRLEDIAFHITSGGTPTSGNARFYSESGQYLFAKTEDLTASKTKYLEHCELKITESALRESSAKIYPVGTILISMYGTIGLTKITRCELAANQALCALMPPFNCDPNYLYQHLEFIRPDWLRFSGQTTQANISGGIVRVREVPLPAISEQKQIAQILDTIDTAIQQTQAIINKLKQLKQGLLHDLLTRGVGANGELRPCYEDAPHLYKESPLGWIPKEWEVVTLEEVADVARGKFTHRPRNDPAFYGGSFPFIQTGDVTAVKGGFVSQYSQTLSVRGILVSQEFPAQTIAITIAANIADTAILAFPMYFPDSVVGAIVKTTANVRYIELCIRRSKRSLDAKAPQSAQKNINLQDLRPLRVPLPLKSEQDEIANRYDVLEKRISDEEAILFKLMKEKSGLMDDLLTGRVRVSSLLQPEASSA